MMHRWLLTPTATRIGTLRTTYASSGGKPCNPIVWSQRPQRGRTASAFTSRNLANGSFSHSSMPSSAMAPPHPLLPGLWRRPRTGSRRRRRRQSSRPGLRPHLARRLAWQRARQALLRRRLLAPRLHRHAQMRRAVRRVGSVATRLCCQRRTLRGSPHSPALRRGRHHEGEPTKTVLLVRP